MTREEAIEQLKTAYPKKCKMVDGRLQGGFDDHEKPLGVALDMAIKALEQELRWIPVSERLPGPQKDCFDKEDLDYSDWVLVSIRLDNSTHDNWVCSAYYCFSKKEWFMERLGCGTVIAWKPVPEPYNAEVRNKK